jgi:hypothetical protein
MESQPTPATSGTARVQRLRANSREDAVPRVALFVLKSKSFHKIGTRRDTALEQYRARKQAVAHARGLQLTRAALFRDKV